jgi:hypothetical protein
MLLTLLGSSEGSMRLSRRRVLWVGLAAAGTAASWGLWRGGGFASLGGVRGEELPDADPGALSAKELATLVAATTVVIGSPVEPTHYAEYYRWRAEHVRGYHALYRAFGGDADRRAVAIGGRSFADSPEEVRRAVLAPPRGGASPRGWLDSLRSVFDGPRWRLYDRYIFAEGLALFARTDAWIALGYRGWPGQARGLDRYISAPA